MNAFHLTVRLADGSRQMLQMLADTSCDALLQAQDAFGDSLRGGSARMLRAPGIVGTVANGRTAANDATFAGVTA